jgi:hypothetical protein
MGHWRSYHSILCRSSYHRHPSPGRGKAPNPWIVSGLDDIPEADARQINAGCPLCCASQDPRGRGLTPPLDPVRKSCWCVGACAPEKPLAKEAPCGTAYHGIRMPKTAPTAPSPAPTAPTPAVLRLKLCFIMVNTKQHQQRSSRVRCSPRARARLRVARQHADQAVMGALTFHDTDQSSAKRNRSASTCNPCPSTRSDSARYL